MIQSSTCTNITEPPAHPRTWLVGLGLFGMFAALFGFIQFSIPGLADNDSYYHIKMGWLIHTQGIKPDFIWLPRTILNQTDYYDHHMLYHVYLALFTWRDPALDSGAALVVGAKIASVVLAAVTFVAVWWLLRAQRVRWAAAWALGLFALSDIFLFRLSMVRAQTASLLVLMLALHWLLQRRYRMLLPLGFGYVWLYNAFPLLLLLAGTYAFGVLLSKRRIAWPALIYPSVGIALGLVLNPYFPENIIFIIKHIGPKLGVATTEIGAEWYPYDSWTLMKTAGLAYALGIAGLTGLVIQRRGFTQPQLITFGLYLVFGILTLNSKRFMEYFPAFALVFGALSLAPVLADWRNSTPLVWRRARLAASTLLLLALLLTLTNARNAMLALNIIKPASLQRDAARWLNQNVAANTLIYNADWRQFPRLFFYNSSNRYLLGLDPTYLQLADANAYALYTAINAGKVAQPGTAIQQTFGATYLIADRQQTELIAQAQADPTLREVYRSEDSVIWAVQP